METSKQKLQAMARNLREIADLIEARDWPEGVRFATPDVYLFCDTPEIFGDAVRVLGDCTKDASGEWLNATRRYGSFKFEITIERDKACERVKVGEKVIPASEERVIPAKPERVEEVFEWKCPDSFLGQGKRGRASSDVS